MKILRGLHQDDFDRLPCVVSIGNFDGLHRGHQAILKQLKQRAEEKKAVTTVVIFEPQPKEFFQDEHPPARLMRFQEKIVAFEPFGVDRVLCLPFDDDIASLQPRDFVEQILHQRLNACHVLVGEDFRFGKNRAGDFALLEELGAAFEFSVESMPDQMLEGARISSSRVREALAAGDLKQAEQVLGHPFTLSGIVVHGDGRGRELGCPTANIALHRAVVPVHGIFIVEVTGLGSCRRPAVASVGTRPAVNGKKWLLEVHLLDFDEDIYGEHLNVSFITKLRDEENYDTLEALTAQIAKDVAAAHTYFATHRL